MISKILFSSRRLIELVEIFLVTLTMFCNLHMVHACGGNYTGVAGIIPSGSYDNDMDCFYKIYPPSGQYTYVEITTDMFSVESSWDFVYIYDGPSKNSALLATLTGELNYFYVRTSQPYATIEFKTDFDVTDLGFTMRYQYKTGTPPFCAGPKMLMDNDGTVFFNTSGALIVDPSTICEWRILPPSTILPYACSAQLELTLLNWQDSTNFASVDVYSGPNSLSSLVGRFTVISSPGDHLYVQYNYPDGIFLQFSTTSLPGSFSQFAIAYKQVLLCQDYPTPHHPNHVLGWFISVSVILVIGGCIASIYAKKRMMLKKTAKEIRHNMAVSMQSLSSPVDESYFVPQVSVAAPASIPAIYHPYAPMVQPVPHLFPSGVVQHGFGRQQPPIVQLEEQY